MARSLADKLTYANIAATLALFLALGGISYAAIALPADSVGKRELRPGAVTPRALDFPLQARELSYPRLDLKRNGCIQPPAPGQPAPPCAPSIFQGELIGHPARIFVRSPGKLEISLLAGVSYEGSPQTTASANLDLTVDRKLLATARIRTTGGQVQQLPLQGAASVAPGTHVIEVRALAGYDERGPGDLVMSPASIIVNVLPGG